MGIFVSKIKKYKLLFCLAVGLMLGTCLVNLWNIDIIFSEQYNLGYNLIDKTSSYMWAYILEKRITQFAIITILMFTPVYMFALYFIYMYLGLSISIVLGSSILNNGMSGVLITLQSLMPHFLFYIFIIILLSNLHENRKNIKNVMVIIALVILLLLIATFLESFVNPLFMRMFI